MPHATPAAATPAAAALPDTMPQAVQQADADSRRAAWTFGLCLPTDVVLDLTQPWVAAIMLYGAAGLVLAAWTTRARAAGV